MPSQFYMIWKDNGNAPTRQHSTYDLALEEAQRLAKLTPNSVYYVLSAIVAVTNEPNITVSSLNPRYHT